MNILNINKYSILLFLSIIFFSCNKTNVIDVSDASIAGEVTIPIKIGFNGLVKLHSQNTLESDDGTASVAASPINPINDVAIFVSDSNGKIISHRYYSNIPNNHIINYKIYQVVNATVICMVNIGSGEYNKIKSLNKKGLENAQISYSSFNNKGFNNKGIDDSTHGTVYMGESKPVDIKSPNQSVVVNCKPLSSKLNIILLIKKNRNIHLNEINLCNISKVVSNGSVIKPPLFPAQKIAIPSLASTGTAYYDEYEISTIKIGDNWAGSAGLVTTLEDRAKYAPASASYIEIATSVGSADMLTGNNYYKARIYLGDISNLKIGKSDYNVKSGNDYNVTITINDYNNITTDSRVTKSDVIFKYLVDVNSSELSHTLRFSKGFNGFVDWGDGSDITPNAASPTAPLVHRYSAAGMYVVNVYGKWVDKNVIFNLYGNNPDGNVSLFYLGGAATEFHLEGFKAKVADVDKDFFQACSNTLINLSNAFEGTSIKSIPAGLLNNCTKVTDLSNMFCDCHRLTGSIPPRLLYPCVNVTNLASIFNGCSGLTGPIPPKLLYNCTLVTALPFIFNVCSGLTGSIPSNFLDKSTQATKLQGMFSGCSRLTGSIPTGLLYPCANVTDLSLMFSGCSGLIGSIPSGLLNNCARVTNLSSLFKNCQRISGTIPKNLFANCKQVTDLSSVFNGCLGLIGSIPARLLASCTRVNDLSAMFNRCQKLTGSIPSGFLNNSAGVIDLSSMFEGCSALTGTIPSGFFNNCKQVTNLSFMFGKCLGLSGTVPTELLDNCTHVLTLSFMFTNDKGLSGSLRLPKSYMSKTDWNKGTSIVEIP